MIVVTGARGQLGTAFRKILAEDAVFLGRAELDLANLESIAPTLAAFEPTVVINCAAYTAVDRAEDDEEAVNLVNGYAVGELAGVCRDLGAKFVTFSTDYVFDGTKDGGYVESDTPNPINAYGRSKLLGERLALEANPEALIVRTSWLLSGTHPNFIAKMLELLAKGDVSVVSDQFGRPTIVDDLALATVEAMNRGVTGLLHLTNDGTTTWYRLACEIAGVAGMDSGRLHPCATADYPTPAMRPANSVLDSERIASSGVTPMPLYRYSLRRAVQRAIVAG